MKYKVLNGFVLPQDMREKGKVAKVGEKIDFGNKNKALIGVLLKRGKIEPYKAPTKAKK